MESTSPVEDVGMVTAPWTPAQVESLNEYQKSGAGHPFTCGNDHGGQDTLVATPDGWICLDCDYTQAWAHDFMANGKWVYGLRQRARMLAQIATKSPEGRCQACWGCGYVANDEDKTPWSVWEELPPGSDLAVQAGIVRPQLCPSCDGTGKERNHG